MNIIATLYDPKDYEELYRPIREAGYEVRWVRLSEGAPGEMIEKLSGYPCIIASGECYSAEVLRALAEGGLKLIVRMGTGYDHVDIDAARDLGVDVANLPGANAESVAEHALMLTLCAARGAGRDNAAMHRGRWSQGQPKDLLGCTFGLVGFGNIARRYARLVRPLAGRILAYDPFVDCDALAQGVEPVSLEELLASCDVISLHVPLTERTRGMFGTEAFLRMRRGAVLVNTSRGEVVDEAALCAALTDGTLAGAGLDVYCREPISADNPLCRLDNCVMTPHDAALTDAAFRSMTRAAVESILAKFTGVGQIHIVNARPSNAKTACDGVG